MIALIVDRNACEGLLIARATDLCGTFPDQQVCRHRRPIQASFSSDISSTNAEV